MPKKVACKPIYILFVFAIIAIFFVRVIYLDQDIAPWGVSMYQPVDEGAYAYLAINEKAYGTICPDEEYEGKEIPFYLCNNFITNIFGNVSNILGLHTLGNNYYGLRVPYVAIGFINLILFWRILRNIRLSFGIGTEKEKFLELLLLFLMVADFSMFNASRIVEPTSVRLLFVQIIVLIFISNRNNHTTRFLLLGLLITFSCFLVYITNAFLYLATFAILFIGAKKRGKEILWKEVCWFLTGCVIMFCVAEGYYHFIWGTEAIQNALSTIKAFANNSSAELTVNSSFSLPYTLSLLYARVVSSNAFFYNLPLLFGGFILTVPCVRLIKKKNDRELLFLLALIISFFCQTIISSDTITRKIIVIYPIIISLLFALFVSNESLEIMEEDRIKEQNKRKGKIITGTIWCFAAMNVILSYVYRAFLYNWTRDDFDTEIKLIILFAQVLPLLIVGCSKLFSLVTNNKLTDMINKGFGKTVIMAIILVSLSNLLITAKYYWIQPEFTERDAMIELSDYVDNKYVLGGGYQLGFTLYNDMKPVVNTPEEIIKTADIMGDCLYLDYEFTGVEKNEYFNRYFSNADMELNFDPIHTIQRNFKTFGSSRNMCLYELKWDK